MQKTWAQALRWEDPLEKGMTTHSSILSWRIPWTEEPGGLQPMGSQRVRHDSVLGQEDSLDQVMSTHSCILSWKNPWTGEPGELQPMRLHSQTLLSTPTQPQFSLTFADKLICLYITLELILLTRLKAIYLIISTLVQQLFLQIFHQLV